MSPHPISRPGRRGGVVVLTVLMLSGLACREPTERSVQLPAQVRSDQRVRDVRVLIIDNASDFRVRIDGPYVVRSPAAGVLARGGQLPWVTVSRATGDFHVGNRRWTAGTIEIVPEPRTRLLISRREGGKWSGPLAYAGYLRCERQHRTTMDVINVVNIDQYVAGVLPGELYADWHTESFRAGAVAARTYALWQMAKSAHRSYDVRATEASQVYGGIPVGPAARKARDAAAYTRGIVCTWTSPKGERIFCTYYSSACGGRTQNVSYCMNEDSIPPLAGGVRCNYCRIAPRKTNAYRWGPTSISKTKLSQRLARRFPSLRSIGAVERVDIARRGKASGRPAAFRVVGSGGRSRLLNSEEFRLAVGSGTMRSSDCTIVNRPDEIQFTDGRGFGHGVGLCQWGMQGQALLGRKAGQILKFYYPGVHLTRAY